MDILGEYLSGQFCTYISLDIQIYLPMYIEDHGVQPRNHWLPVPSYPEPVEVFGSSGKDSGALIKNSFFLNRKKKSVVHKGPQIKALLSE